MSTNNNTNTGGIGFVGLLAIVFIALKLTGYITWSWWWVLSPLWLTPVVILTIMAVVVVFAFLWAVFDSLLESRKNR